MASEIPIDLAQRQWFIAGRWQEYAGEARANLLRTMAIGSFYIVELLRFYLFEPANPAQLKIHQQATMMAVAWTMLVLAILLCLRLRVFPTALKYLSTLADVVLLTTLAALLSGPFSPLVLGYFFIIALASLRFSVQLIWFATLASILGYWLLVGIEDAKTSRWFDAQHAVSPTTQLLTLLTLGLTGIVLGQAVRQVKLLAADYAARLKAAEKIA